MPSDSAGSSVAADTDDAPVWIAGHAMSGDGTTAPARDTPQSGDAAAAHDTPQSGDAAAARDTPQSGDAATARDTPQSGDAAAARSGGMTTAVTW